MIIICGKTIEEVERDLEMAKAAIATGAPIGVGGATIEDVEQALCGLRSAVGESNLPISNPNYDPRWSCPECGAEYPIWDGECCSDCGYGWEDEEEDEVVPPAVAALVEMLRYLGADEDTINKLLS